MRVGRYKCPVVTLSSNYYVIEDLWWCILSTLHISVALATLKKYVADQGKLQLVSRVSRNVRCLRRNTLTVRGTVVSETLFGESHCLRSGGVVQIEYRTGRG